ncbi:transposase [Poseidonocella sp. HB161398]|uniref:transposase n=1 Tax=Poseidonocella sp. HB161398 TaxID=2320855 RepID=UPI001108846A
MPCRAGRADRRIRHLRSGTCFPAFPAPRGSARKALAAAIQDADAHGVSTRTMDDPVQAMGAGGFSWGQISRLCAKIGERADTFLRGGRPGADGPSAGKGSPSAFPAPPWLVDRCDLPRAAPGRPDRSGGGRARGLHRHRLPAASSGCACRAWRPAPPGPSGAAAGLLRRDRRHGSGPLWKRCSGRHVRSGIEAGRRPLKSSAERIPARDPDRQTAEIRIRASRGCARTDGACRASKHRFNAPGAAEIRPVPRPRLRKGASRPDDASSTNAPSMPRRAAPPVRADPRTRSLEPPCLRPSHAPSTSILMPFGIIPGPMPDAASFSKSRSKARIISFRSPARPGCRKPPSGRSRRMAAPVKTGPPPRTRTCGQMPEGAAGTSTPAARCKTPSLMPDPGEICRRRSPVSGPGGMVASRSPGAGDRDRHAAPGRPAQGRGEDRRAAADAAEARADQRLPGPFRGRPPAASTPGTDIRARPTIQVTAPCHAAIADGSAPGQGRKGLREAGPRTARRRRRLHANICAPPCMPGASRRQRGLDADANACSASRGRARGRVCIAIQPSARPVRRISRRGLPGPKPRRDPDRPVPQGLAAHASAS